MAVLEPSPGKITALLRDKLTKLGKGNSQTLTQGAQQSSFSGRYDLFIVTSNESNGESRPQNLETKILLIPGDISPKIAAGISSDWVVSYGLSGKDTITFSSLEPGFALLALQRELVTLAGAVVEQQEIPLPFPRPLSSLEVMVLYASLLVLGIPPETLAIRE